MFYGVSKFGSGLVGLNNVVFCNPDLISVKSVDKIYISNAANLSDSCRQHVSKR